MMTENWRKTMTDRMDVEHPEKAIPGLQNSLEIEKTLEEGQTIRSKFPKELFPETYYDRPRGAEDIPTLLCRSCGWSVGNECGSFYNSRIQIFYTRYETGLWSVGLNWIIKDAPKDESMGNEQACYDFIKALPDGEIVPLVKEMRPLSAPDDKVQLTLMSRAPGKMMSEVWDDLTPEQQIDCGKQLAEALKCLRRPTRPYPQNFDGTAPYDPTICFGQNRYLPTCNKVGRTKNEWFDSIAQALRWGIRMRLEADDPEPVLQELRDSIPEFGQCVLSHLDLHSDNIMIHNGRIEAILDWEFGAFLPWWWEIFGTYIRWQGIDFFKFVWPHVYPGMTRESFANTMGESLEKLAEFYHFGHAIFSHPNSRNEVYMRPPFCACKPYCGKGHLRDHKHEVDKGQLEHFFGE